MEQWIMRMEDRANSFFLRRGELDGDIFSSSIKKPFLIFALFFLAQNFVAKKIQNYIMNLA